MRLLARDDPGKIPQQLAGTLALGDINIVAKGFIDKPIDGTVQRILVCRNSIRVHADREAELLTLGLN